MTTKYSWSTRLYRYDDETARVMRSWCCKSQLATWEEMCSWRYNDNTVILQTEVPRERAALNFPQSARRFLRWDQHLLLCNSFVLSQITRLTDGQRDRRTDGRTDRILVARSRLHFMQRSKNRSAPKSNTWTAVLQIRVPVNSSHGQLVTARNRMTSWPAPQTPCVCGSLW